MRCVVPLFSGIGNVIQMLPFAFEMGRRYGKVDAYVLSLDFREPTLDLVRGIFPRIYRSRRDIPRGCRVFRKYVRKACPEYKTWFHINKEKLPESFGVDRINYKKTHMRHRVVICPDCKGNWPCKDWPYWADLASRFKKPLIVGIDKRKKILNGGDARGKLSIRQIGGLIKNAEIFIGGDCGLTHYAAALGTKTYMIFGATDPDKNMPPRNAVEISKDLPCRPCQYRKKMLKQKGRILGCGERRCLTELSAEEVAARIA